MASLLYVRIHHPWFGNASYRQIKEWVKETGSRHSRSDLVIKRHESVVFLRFYDKPLAEQWKDYLNGIPGVHATITEGRREHNDNPKYVCVTA